MNRKSDFLKNAAVWGLFLAAMLLLITVFLAKCFPQTYRDLRNGFLRAEEHPEGESVETFGAGDAIYTMTAYEDTETEMTSETDAFFDACIMPVSGKITSPFGYREDPFDGTISLHRGTDIGVAEGTDVLAMADGTVIASRYDSIGGHFIKIQHDHEIVSYYGHLGDSLVEEGDTVKKGQIIAKSGNSGKTTGPHLHFQITFHGNPTDAIALLMPHEN